jgi:RecA-family ATPase
MTFDTGEPRTTPFFDQLSTIIEDEGIELLILDTVADIFSGDQNNPIHVRHFVQHALGRLARQMKGAVIMCAHPSRDGQRQGNGESGSQQWDAALRSRMYLSRPEVAAGEGADPDARILTRKKANYAPRDEQMNLRWQHGVLVSVDAPGSIDRIAHAVKAERVVKYLLQKTYNSKAWVSASQFSRTYAPKVFSLLPDREGINRHAFEIAMNRLIDSGEVVLEDHGRPSERRTRLAPSSS